MINQELRQEIHLLKQKIKGFEQSETKHNETMGQFQSRLEAINDWVWEIDKGGFCRYSNKKVKDLLGYEPEDIIGKEPSSLIPKNEANRVAALFNKSAKSHRPFSRLENVNHHKDGREVILEINATPIIDAQGDFAGYRGIHRDITERKRAEEALQESKTSFRDLVEMLPEIVFELDMESRVTYGNQMLSDLLG